MSAAGENREMVRRLIQEIRRAGLTVGDRLPSIRQLAATLGVKTNVIRDSMVQAQTMGLLKIYPRSGAFVQSLNFAPLVTALSDTLETVLQQEDHNLFHLLDARGILEVELAGQAAVRRSLEDMLPVRQALEDMRRFSKDPVQNIEADVEFHLCIARIAGNPVLVTMLQALLGLLRPCLVRVKAKVDREKRLRSEVSHEAIYHAILEGDTERVRLEMREHVGLARACLLEKVQAPTARQQPAVNGLAELIGSGGSSRSEASRRTIDAVLNAAEPQPIL